MQGARPSKESKQKNNNNNSNEGSKQRKGARRGKPVPPNAQIIDLDKGVLNESTTAILYHYDRKFSHASRRPVN